MIDMCQFPKIDERWQCLWWQADKLWTWYLGQCFQISYNSGCSWIMTVPWVLFKIATWCKANLYSLLFVIKTTLSCIIYTKRTINPKRAGGIRPPSTFRAIISWNFFFAVSFHDFFLWSLAQLWALFSENSGVRFQSYATLCNRALAQSLKIFWICVQNVWKWLLVPKLHFEL